MQSNAPPEFNLDVIIKVAEGRAREVQNELGWLQTDLEYFCERAA